MHVHLGDCKKKKKQFLMAEYLKLSVADFPTAGTLSACVDERTGDHPAHAAALHFLAAAFTEETKSRGAEVPTSSAAAAAASSSSSVRDTLNSPAAGRLCELLLQVQVEVKG